MSSHVNFILRFLLFAIFTTVNLEKWTDMHCYCQKVSVTNGNNTLFSMGITLASAGLYGHFALLIMPVA